MSSIKTVQKWMNAMKDFAKTLSITDNVVICKGCKNSKVIINKDGKSYEYSYDENGKQTLEIK